MSTPATGSPGWERFDADGGVGVIGRGQTLADAFGQTALGMFAVITDLDGVHAREVREVRAHGDTVNALLASWLNECLYVHEVEGFVACRVEVGALDERPRVGGEPFRLHAVLRGEELDPARHAEGIAVTGVLGQEMSVVKVHDAFEVRAVLDAH